MQPLGIQQLQRKLASICEKTQQEIDFIASELVKTAGSNSAGVVESLRKISITISEAIRFLPTIMASQAVEVENNGPLDNTQAHAWAELNRASFEVRSWVNQWHEIENLIRQQFPPKRRQLYRSPEETPAIAKTQAALADAAFNDLHAILNPAPQSEHSRDHGCFADITLPQSEFLQHAHAAYRVLLAKHLRHPTRFLDVGCGGGFKVLTASRLFNRADGLEYDPAYVDMAQSLFDRSQKGTCHIIQADGLKYSDYDVYDVIYFYRPMRHIEQLKALELKIIDNTRPSTLIIAPYQMFATRYESYGCAHIAGCLYISRTSQSDADALRQKAEMTGSFIKTNQPKGKSFWDPIINASHSMGFG